MLVSILALGFILCIVFILGWCLAANEYEEKIEQLNRKHIEEVEGWADHVEELNRLLIL